MSVHPLRPDTRRRLGGPSPRRLADRTRTAPPARPEPLSSFPFVPKEIIRYYPVFLPAVPVGWARRPRVTHQSATLGRGEPLLAVRLACLRRAASVRSEPGSNSPSLLFQAALKERLISNFSLSLMFKEFGKG